MKMMFVTICSLGMSCFAYAEGKIENTDGVPEADIRTVFVNDDKIDVKKMTNIELKESVAGSENNFDRGSALSIQ
ncbi:MAG: hypothetical protein OEY52_01705 [Gammaproteobacteria bacterium]|nr:hypothetical protein [Gammaproteobacteria bacterium]